MRIRTIKPEFFLHEALFDLERESSLPVRLSFAGLWCAADREGRFKWEPRKLKAQILPYDDIDFSRVLHALVTRGFVVRYASHGLDLGCITSFLRHQVINNRERPSALPALVNGIANQHVDASTTRDPRVDHACPTPLNLDQEEGKGRERKGEPPTPFSGGELELAPEDPNPTPPPKPIEWTAEQIRLNRIFRRKLTTPWTDKEIKAFKALGQIDDSELRLIEAYYSAKIPVNKDIRRRDLRTLLNNFPGEVDRARAYKPQHFSCF